MATSLPDLSSLTEPASAIQADEGIYGETGFGPISFPTLPAFESTAPSLPNVTQAPASPSSSSPFLQGLLHPFNTASQLAQSATGSSLGSILKISLEDGVFIVLGLLLIAAGIFSFRQTQTIIREGGRAAASVAAAA